MDPMIIAVFIAGLFLGALLNLVIIRLPRERALGGWPRCTRCGRRLSWWQALPLVGWLAQGGRGRCCGQPLKWLFPLIEIMSGSALALFYARYGLGALFYYLGFVTAEGYAVFFGQAVEAIASFLDGKTPPRVVAPR